MKNIIHILVIINLLIGCSGTTKSVSQQNNRKKINTEKTDAIVKDKKNQDFLSYFFSNDSLCQNLIIKKINKNSKKEIPESIEFELILSDNLGHYSQKKFDGIASLSSSNESFLDQEDNDAGVYFAADYIFSGNFKIRIRVDIENYEACIVYLETNHPEKDLGEYRYYVKNYPNYNLMKKGSCIN